MTQDLNFTTGFLYLKIGNPIKMCLKLVVFKIIKYQVLKNKVVDKLITFCNIVT